VAVIVQVVYVSRYQRTPAISPVYLTRISQYLILDACVFQVYDTGRHRASGGLFLTPHMVRGCFKVIRNEAQYV